MPFAPGKITGHEFIYLFIYLVGSWVLVLTVALYSKVFNCTYRSARFCCVRWEIDIWRLFLFTTYGVAWVSPSRFGSRDLFASKTITLGVVVCLVFVFSISVLFLYTRVVVFPFVGFSAYWVGLLRRVHGGCVGSLIGAFSVDSLFASICLEFRCSHAIDGFPL